MATKTTRPRPPIKYVNSLPEEVQVPRKSIEGSEVGNRSLALQKIAGKGNFVVGQTDYDTGVGIFLGLHLSTPKFSVGDSAGNKMTWDGSVLSIVGSLSVGSTAGGWTIDATSIYTGTEDHSGYTANAGDMTIYSDGVNSSIHAFNFYIDTDGNFHTRAGDITGVSINGIPNDTATDLSLLALTHDMVFSATDLDTVAWSTGTITFSNGRTFSITGNNTGTMSAKTYIYLDTAISSTALQITTSPTTAHGANKVTLAVAVNSTDKAEFLTYHGTGTRNILVDNIATNSSSTNEFVANTAQIKNLVVTNAKINDLAVSKLTAGTINSQSIVLEATTSDVEIRSGIATGDFSNTGAASGFIIGKDFSDSDKVKFYFGNPTRNLVFDGTTFTVNGYVVTGKGAFGGDGADGALTISSGTTTTSLSNASSYIKNYTSISITGTGSQAFSDPHANGTIFIIKSQGAVTMTTSATAFNVSSMGGTGGAGATGANSDGTPGSAGNSNMIFQSNFGTAGSTPTNPGVGGASRGAFVSGAVKLVPLFCGAGGGGASEGDGGNPSQGGGGGASATTAGTSAAANPAGAGTGDGGTGGRGGGALYIECGGAYNTSSTLSAAGANGTNGGTADGSGGGGGGGGCIIIFYNTLTSDTGTYTVTGGTGGTEFNPGTSDGVDGGNGGAGYSLVAINNVFA